MCSHLCFYASISSGQFPLSGDNKCVSIHKFLHTKAWLQWKSWCISTNKSSQFYLYSLKLQFDSGSFTVSILRPGLPKVGYVILCLAQMFIARKKKKHKLLFMLFYFCGVKILSKYVGSLIINNFS